MKLPSNYSVWRRTRASGRPAIMLGILIFAAACASVPAPTEQVAVSSAAVARAASAGGGEAAPAEMQTARDKLDRAKLAMAAEDFDVARRLAQQAQVDAQLAEAKARTGKASKASQEVSTDAKVLREELDRKAQSPTDKE